MIIDELKDTRGDRLTVSVRFNFLRSKSLKVSFKVFHMRIINSVWTSCELVLVVTSASLAMMDYQNGKGARAFSVFS